MSAVPDHICPPGVLESLDRAAPELLKALLVRSNFIPGVRHRLGWRGIKDCRLDTEAWTMRVQDRPGVFGIRLLDVQTLRSVCEGAFPLSYFPHPEEDLVECYSVRAGLIAQSGEYLDRVRCYLAHPELRELFTVGMVRLAVDTESRTCCLTMQAPGRSLITARQGVRVQHEGREVELVAPGGADQDLAAWDVALPFFRTLAATTSFSMRQGPCNVQGHDRPGREISYDESGAFCSTRPLEESEHSLRLCYGTGPWDVLEKELFKENWHENLAWSWNTGQERPAALADEPWWDAEVPGARNSLDKNSLGIAERPVLLVLSGFLGAGKTTFLQHFIEHQAAHNQFVAVIQNEIGEQGLDSRLLDQQYAVTEVDEGCVCCSLVGSLKAAVHDILQRFQPDCIVLETTGLANPANLLGELGELEELVEFDSVTTLVDGAEGLHCLEKYEVAREQARTADLLVLNKIDLIDTEQRLELEGRLRKLNPRAPIVYAEQGDVPPGLLFGVNLRRELKGGRLLAPFLPDLRRPDHSHDRMSSIRLPQPDPLRLDCLMATLEKLPESIFRLKGLVRIQGQEQLHVVQCVAGRCSVYPANSDMRACDPFLVAIGTDARSFAEREPFAHCC
ncbi:MAG: GTP-binding protein [Desulfovibrionaceae bacterium]